MKGSKKMKTKFYEVIFDVTETLQNGNERKTKKSVFMKPFDEATGKHNSPEMQIEKGFKALKAEHYYNIVYVETKVKTMIFA